LGGECKTCSESEISAVLISASLSPSNGAAHDVKVAKQQKKDGDSPPIISRPTTLNDDLQIRLPQELVEHIIDCLSDDCKMLQTCALVAPTWSARSRHHLFSNVSLNSKEVGQWCSAIRPGPDGVSSLVRTLSLQQAQGHKWLATKTLNTIPEHFSSFRHVEILSVAWLDLSDFSPGSLTRHFIHYETSLRSLRLSYLFADYSALLSFLQLFQNLENLLIHTPELSDDNPRHISRAGPTFHGSLNLLSFDSTSSPFVSHLAGLDLRFSSISAYHCDFSSGLPLTSLLEASSSSLRCLELEYITFFCADSHFHSSRRAHRLTSQPNVPSFPSCGVKTSKM